MLLHQPVDYHADLRPARPAIDAHDHQWTYSDLVARSHAIARFLQSQNVQVGERIAVLGLNSATHFALYLAASRIGAVTVSVNFRLAPAELAFILDDAQARILFVTDSSFDEAVTQTITQRTGETHLVADRADAATSLQAVMTTVGSPVVRLEAVDENEAVLQLYTSGTTGKPKGAVLSHRNVSSLVGMMAVTNDGQYTSTNVDLTVAPLFHIGGVGVGYIILATGGHCILQEAFDPVRVVETIQTRRVNTMFMVPAMIQAIVKLVPNIEGYELSSLQSIAYGAAPISASLLREALDLFGCKMQQVYGMTETTGTVVALSFDDHQRALAGEEHLLRSCGKPCPGNEVKIIDDHGAELGPNETGQICLRSSSNMLGYFNRAQATAETIQDGWVHTGDAGFRDEEGFVFLRDRLKDMVVSGGENIYPVEVENVLAAMPGVIEVAVIGVPDEQFGEALLAVFALKPDSPVTLETMIEHCRPQLAGYKIPRQIEVVDALPRNPSGKVLKTVLREPWWRGHERRIG